jgi:hypothetical protein
MEASYEDIMDWSPRTKGGPQKEHQKWSRSQTRVALWPTNALTTLSLKVDSQSGSWPWAVKIAAAAFTVYVQSQILECGYIVRSSLGFDNNTNFQGSTAAPGSTAILVGRGDSATYSMSTYSIEHNCIIVSQERTQGEELILWLVGSCRQ